MILDERVSQDAVRCRFLHIASNLRVVEDRAVRLHRGGTLGPFLFLREKGQATPVIIYLRECQDARCTMEQIASPDLLGLTFRSGAIWYNLDLPPRMAVTIERVINGQSFGQACHDVYAASGFARDTRSTAADFRENLPTGLAEFMHLLVIHTHKSIDFPEK